MSTPSKKPLQPISDHFMTEKNKAGGKVASYQVYRQGFLLKPVKGVRKRLARYWFVLFEQKELLAFLYFADEDHYLERKKNEGFIRIDDATSIDVVPEYMGRKNAFCITTPRNKFYLASESRYELHHWLLALHEAMDTYKQHTLQKKKKTPTGGGSRPRSSSTSGTQNTNITPTHNTSIGKTPPSIKPSRPAPRPPPQSKKKENEPPNRDQMGHEHNISPVHHSNHHGDTPTSPTTSPLDAIVAGLLAQTNTMDEVEYNMTEEEPLGDDYHLGGGVEDEGSPSLSTFRVPSTSMPMLNSSKEGTESPPSSQENQFTTSYDERNTLPLDGQGHRRSIKKRNSTKGLRSVSPPNLPPPPPPPQEIITEQDTEESYLQVMTDFNDTLNEISANMQAAKQNSASPQMTLPTSIKPLPPVRISSLSPGRKHKIIESHLQEGGDSDEVHSYLDEAFQREDIQGLSTDDDEETTPAKPAPISPGILRKEDSGSKLGKRTVIFQEDQKRIDPSYEPRIDKERPLSVAEAKMKLFGQQETKVARYRRSNTIEDEKTDEPSINNNDDTTNIMRTSHNEEVSTFTVPAPPTNKNENEKSKDDLVQFIESALESTSYMETPPPSHEGGVPPTKKGFFTMVGENDAPPTMSTFTPPTHYTLSAHVNGGEEGTEGNESPLEDSSEPHPTSNGQPVWSATSGGSNFNNNSQNPVYRSLV